jgi:ABC-2 type transport system permease protein
MNLWTGFYSSELKNQNFDELEKDTRLVINNKIGFDTKQKLFLTSAMLSKRKNKATGHPGNSTG